MSIDIQPFNQENSEPNITGDARTSDFMDALRSRITAKDEKQQEKWAKSVKPAKARKPVEPGNPAWMNRPTPAPAPAQPPVNRSRPFGSPKPKRV